MAVSTGKGLEVQKNNDAGTDGIEVVPKHIFGFNAQTRNGLIYIDDVTVAYVAGHYVVLYNNETKHQRLLPCHTASLGVTCLAASPSKRYLAVAESFLAQDQHEEANETIPTVPTVTIYDLQAKSGSIRKSRVISIHPRNHTEAEVAGKSGSNRGTSWPTSGCVTGMSFAADDKSLVTIAATAAETPSTVCCWIAHWNLDKPSGGGTKLSAWTKSQTELGRDALIASKSYFQISPATQGGHRRMSAPRRASGTSLTSSPGKGNRGGSHSDVAVVHDVTCHPTDTSIVSVVGDGILKIYRIGDGLMKPVSIQPPGKGRDGENGSLTGTNFSCQTWLSDGRLLVGTEGGDLFLYENNGEYKGPVSPGPGEHRACLCAVSTSKGFLLGGIDSMIRIYERSLDSKEGYLLLKEFRVDLSPVKRLPTRDDEEEGRERRSREASRESADVAPEAIERANRFVSALALSPNGAAVAAGISNHQMYLIHLNADDNSSEDDEENEDEDDEEAFPSGGKETASKGVLELLLAPLHTGPITGLSMCVRKPLVATCGVDRSVRIWNYMERTCDIAKTFKEEVNCVSMHPSGFGLIVAFADRIKIMNILMDDIKEYKELPLKGCKEVKYSHGGHLFAVAVSANQVQIYKSYSGELFCTTVTGGGASMRATAGVQGALAAAGLGERVQVMEFSEDDTTIAVITSDGVVYEYALLGVEGVGGMCRSVREWRPKTKGVRPVGLALVPAKSQDTTIPHGAVTGLQGANVTAEGMSSTGASSSLGTKQPTAPRQRHSSKNVIYITCSDGTIVEVGRTGDPSTAKETTYDTRPSVSTAMRSFWDDELSRRGMNDAAGLTPIDRMAKTKSGVPQVAMPSLHPLVVPTSLSSKPMLLFGSSSLMIAKSLGASHRPSPGLSLPVSAMLEDHSDSEAIRDGKVLLPSTLKVFTVPSFSSKRSSKRHIQSGLVKSFMELEAHRGGISRMIISYNDGHLLTVSEDGSLIIFQIWLPHMATASIQEPTPVSPVNRATLLATKKSGPDGNLRKAAIGPPALPRSEEALVTRAYLEKREGVLVELDRQVEELRHQIDYQLRLRDEQHREKASQLESEYSDLMKAEVEGYEQLKEDKNIMQGGYEEELFQLDKSHEDQLKELKDTFEHKMALENQRLDELNSSSQKESMEWAIMRETIETKHKNITEAMERVFEEERRKNREARAVVLEAKDKDFAEHHQKLKAIEREADDEIETVKRRYEALLGNEKDEKVRLRGQAGIHKKHHEDLKRQMGYKEEKKIEALVKEQEANAKEMEEREKTIEDKDRRMSELRKQNQELEKFKFVLDYKIRELKEQVDPKADEIAKMKVQTHSMDAEIEECMRRNKNLSLEVSEMNMKQKALLLEIKEQQSKIKEQHLSHEGSQIAVRESYREVMDPRKLKKNVTRLYHTLILNDGLKDRDESLNGDALDEQDCQANSYQKAFNRQRDYLEKCMITLKKKFAKDAEVHRTTNMRVMQDNVALIREINNLRRELALHKNESAADDRLSSAGSTVHSEIASSSVDDLANYEKEAAMQRREIEILRQQLEEIEQSVPRSAGVDSLPCDQLVKGARLVERLDPKRQSNNNADLMSAANEGFAFDLVLSVDHKLHNKKSTAVLVNCDGRGLDSEYIVVFKQPEATTHISAWSPHVHHSYGSHFSCEFVYWIEALANLGLVMASCLILPMYYLCHRLPSAGTGLMSGFTFFAACWQLHVLLFWIHIRIYGSDGLGSPILAFISHMLAVICDCGISSVLLLTACAQQPGPDLSLRVLGIVAADIVCLLKEGESASDRFLLVPWPMIKENDLRLSFILVVSRLLAAQRIFASLIASHTSEDLKLPRGKGIIGIVALIWLGLTPFSDWYTTYAFPSGELLVAVLAVEGPLMLIIAWGLAVASSTVSEEGANAGFPDTLSRHAGVNPGHLGNLQVAMPNEVRTDHPFGKFDNGFE
ncbi:WD repeat domain 65 [Perkinsus chesapeaki]|uniref:WD repeat domain 65 n=1 Tax=Perkinsus chesapeaki TaxID=330153 RepID=A0A7J6MTQ3_PERCH|nr:WD repeat domain 65 [Perkinsus chesapeaki]